jgi:aminopeptidase N
MKNILTITLSVLFANFLFGQRISDYHKPNFEEKHFETRMVKADNPLLNNYDVKFYKIDINATNTTKAISGNCTVNAVVVNNPMSTLVLELINSLVVDSVFINNVKLISTHTNDEITVNLPSSFSVGTSFSAVVYYHGTSTGSGISNGNSPTWGSQITWTLSESYHAKDWFPCKQVLSDKADSVYVFVTCPNTLKVGSNGLLKNVVTVPGNKLRYEWKSYYPINYYLPSIAVSNYQEYNIYAHPAGITDSILIQNYLYPNSGYLPYFKAVIDLTPSFIELLSEKYGMYPFKNEKYGHCTAPIGGGMEHQTMTTLSSFDFELVIHELGHMWWGDNVTCSNWQDIWVNEGFATYTHYIGLQNLMTQADADLMIVTTQDDVMADPGGSIYVPLADIMDEQRIFDYRLSYEKGAAIIHQIRFILNDDVLFYNILKNFQQTYVGSVASATDFKNTLETMSGIDFTDYFTQWYYGEGYPTYNIQWSQQANNVGFILNQTTSMPAVTPFFKLPLELKFAWTGGDTTLRFDNTVNNQLFNVTIPHVIQSIQIDPNNWIVNKVGSILLNTSENVWENEINIYPNPVIDYLNIDIPEDYLSKNITFSIVDITGKQLKEITPEKKALSVDLRGLQNGIYFIQNTLNSKPFKFVKTTE